MESRNIIDVWFFALKKCICEENSEKIYKMLSSVFIPSMIDKDGNNLLHYFAKTYHTDIMVHLISSGCNVDNLNLNNESPLALAINCHNVQMVKILLDEGAKYSKALHLVSYKGHSVIVELLLKYGALVTMGDENYRTPLHNAVSAVYEDSFTRRRRVVKLLIDAGSDINAKDKENKTPLHYAVIHNRGEIVELLLKAKADIHSVDSDDCMPLHQAIKEGHMSLAKRLIEAGTNIHWKNQKGRTCFHMASAWMLPEMMQLLIDNGAVVDDVDNENLDPLCYSLVVWGDKLNEQMSMTYDRYADDYCDDAIERVYPEMVDKQIMCLKLLINYGANIHRKYVFSETPILIAIRDCNHTNLIRFILNYGVEINFDHQVIRNIFVYNNGSEYPKLLLRQQALYEIKNPNHKHLDISLIANAYHKSFTIYKTELELLKSIMVHNSVSLLDIIVKQDISRYSKNEEFQKIFNAMHVSTRFPNYGDMISQRFFDEVRKQNLINEAISALAYTLQWNEYGLYIILNKIIKDLSIKDLHNLISSTK